MRTVAARYTNMQVKRRVEYHLRINNIPASYSFIVGVLAGLFERHRIESSDAEKAYELLEVSGDEMAQPKHHTALSVVGAHKQRTIKSAVLF